MHVVECNKSTDVLLELIYRSRVLYAFDCSLLIHPFRSHTSASSLWTMRKLYEVPDKFTWVKTFVVAVEHTKSALLRTHFVSLNGVRNLLSPCWVRLSDSSFHDSRRFYFDLLLCKVGKGFNDNASGEHIRAKWGKVSITIRAVNIPVLLVTLDTVSITSTGYGSEVRISIQTGVVVSPALRGPLSCSCRNTKAMCFCSHGLRPRQAFRLARGSHVPRGHSLHLFTAGEF